MPVLARPEGERSLARFKHGQSKAKPTRCIISVVHLLQALRKSRRARTGQEAPRHTARDASGMV